MKFNARIKVILGFFLAICLIVGAGVLTIYSVKQLLESVESLAEPNEKLRNLNKLLADIYQLDKSRSVFSQSENDSSENVNYYQQIQQEIQGLGAMVADSAELNQVKRINYSVNELMVVYKGLEEVKKSLYTRNFSKEALNNIERKIKRKEELSRLQSLGKIRIGINAGPVSESKSNDEKTSKTNKEQVSSGLLAAGGKQDMEKILGMLRLNLNRVNPENAQPLSGSDSIIYAVRQMVLDINNEEQFLRSRLRELEQELNEKNRSLIINIQHIVASLQDEALLQSKAENESAYALTYKLSFLLGLLIVVGVIGSSGFIFSIVREIKKSETYQEKLAEAKQRSDNLARTKQDFLASMSHEIRNPLHVIQGYNDALSKTPLDSDQQEFVKMIHFASGTLLGIVNDILDFSKLEAGKIKIEKAIIDPLPFFKNQHSFFRQKALEKGIALDFSILLPRGTFFLGDELRINQVLTNLLSNAIKFTDSGKVLLRVYFEKKNSRLVLQVCDTGTGMSQHLQQNLFKEFSQGDGSISRKYGGTGLGLAIVKRLVDLQEGKIDVISKPGTGSQFIVSLPTTLLDKKEEIEIPRVQLDRMEGLRILLVDDDEMGLKFASLLLRNSGAEVIAYTGGLEFEENFVEADFDLALLDIQMPEVDGYQVLGRIKGIPKYRNMPVLAMTANVFARERESLVKEGFEGVLLKPFNESQLIEKITACLRQTQAPRQKEVVQVEAGPAAPNPYRIEGTEEKGGYDLSDIKKFCMGDEDLFKDILEGFYTQTGLDLIRINKAVDEGDYEKIQAIAHQLSSRLGQLKIKERSIAKAIESELKIGKTEKIQELVWELTEKINDLLEDLAERFGYALAD
ncbi:His Kinase A (phospho-acceptor) domain-containing protein [Cyclobacterium xiamenense]|uniref:histidine kinase n=1 Tax=Cyclobacterium xiamenense TaxID=1297121 RepID=A0A1H7BEX0_9BACT|nr:ATP-binding protein [Cyclobacterium xiamenense]SEJ75726.1 His Kinase A (phospho-acceptor) domain-containing protein [Cyclobacterium xiamenense]